MSVTEFLFHDTAYYLTSIFDKIRKCCPCVTLENIMRNGKKRQCIRLLFSSIFLISNETWKLREAIMAQVMNIDTIAVPQSKDKRAYAINFKGLMIHLLDILFVKGDTQPSHYSSDLSEHLQKDLGLTR
jgi:hypothetical protein